MGPPSREGIGVPFLEASTSWKSFIIGDLAGGLDLFISAISSSPP